jgi:hypothetical protein
VVQHDDVVAATCGHGILDAAAVHGDPVRAAELRQLRAQVPSCDLPAGVAVGDEIPGRWLADSGTGLPTKKLIPQLLNQLCLQYTGVSV